MAQYIRSTLVLCVAMAACTGAAGQAAPAAGPAANNLGPDIKLVNVDLSGTPFTSVQVCWPINTLIQPGSNYSLELQAQTDVLQALTWDVSNSSLQLSTNASFRSLFPIVAIVSLPANALEAVANPSTLAETTVDAGFSASDFTVSAPFSSGDINLLGLAANSLRIQTSGIGRVVANGTFTNASVIASGVGSVYVIGVENNVAVNLAGTATVNVGADSGNVTITGQATGVNTVSYDLGTCSVSTPFLLTSPCQQYDLVAPPIIDPTWTCGLRSSGNFTCPAGGLGVAQAVSSANVFPLAAALIKPAVIPPVSPVPQVPSPSVQVPSPILPVLLLPPPSPSPAPVISSPPPSPVLPVVAVPSPSPIPSPSPNVVIRSGQGPEFASAAGPGSQTAISNSGPGAQQTAIGQNSPFPSPNIFGSGGSLGNLNSGFGAPGTDGIAGKRRLQQIQLTGSTARQAAANQVISNKLATQSLPCADISMLQMFG